MTQLLPYVLRLALEDPNHRTEAQLQEIRAFKDASCRMLSRRDGLVRSCTQRLPTSIDGHFSACALQNPANMLRLCISGLMTGRSSTPWDQALIGFHLF